MLHPSEQCDDGNPSNDDGCSGCVKDYGFYCTNAEPSVCTSSCGDGMKALDEDCDDGNLIDSDGCSSSCLIETDSYCDLTVNPSLCDVCGNSK